MNFCESFVVELSEVYAMDLCAERTGDRLYTDMFVVHGFHSDFWDKVCRRYLARSSSDWLAPTHLASSGGRLLSDLYLELEKPSVVDGVGWIRMRHY